MQLWTTERWLLFGPYSARLKFHEVDLRTGQHKGCEGSNTAPEIPPSALWGSILPAQHSPHVSSPAQLRQRTWRGQSSSALCCPAQLPCVPRMSAQQLLIKKKIISQRWILKFKCWLVSSVNKSTAYTFNSTDLIQIKPYITTVMYCTGLLYYKAVLKQQEGFRCDPTLLFSSCKPHWRGCEISSCSSHCILVSSRAAM